MLKFGKQPARYTSHLISAVCQIEKFIEQEKFTRKRTEQNKPSDPRQSVGRLVYFLTIILFNNIIKLRNESTALLHCPESSSFFSHGWREVV